VNEITRTGIAAIFELLEINKSLSTIQLQDNLIDYYSLSNCYIALKNLRKDQHTKRQLNRLNKLQENNLYTIYAVLMLFRK